MKFKRTLSILLLLLFVSITAFSQDCADGPGLPGDDPDAPTTGCDVPLDTWVYVLVIGAVIYGTYRLHNKQKALSA
ncbi:hypothetical protein FFF34_010880 [Inquilinus sp. KBS0705]|nr:hypothetical protein FFF34_010880 [Inquilinus sp. KBS0705]